MTVELKLWNLQEIVQYLSLQLRTSSNPYTYLNASMIVQAAIRT